MEKSTKPIDNITVDDIIKYKFTTDLSNAELTDIPLGWDDGFPKDIIHKNVEYLGYTVVNTKGIKKNIEPIIKYKKFIEFNAGIDPEQKLLKKSLEMVETSDNFIEWVL